MSGAPSWGQTAARLNADLATGEAVKSFTLLQDGSVLYQAGQGSHKPNEVWRADLGQSPTLLSDGTGRGRVTDGIFSEISPDGAYVYFLMKPASDPFSPYFSDVYRTPVGGGTPEPILEREPSGAADIVNHYAIGFTPDKAELLYLSDIEQPGVRELYARSLASGVSRRVTPPRPSNGSLQPGYVRLTPDGSNVVFSTHFDGAWHRELWSVPLAGGTATQLNAGLPTVFYLTPDPFTASGDEVLFDSSVGAYRTPIGGGGPTLLSAPTRTTDLNVSPNGERIAYRQGADLYGVAASGGPIVRYTDDGGLPYYAPLFFTPNGERLIYADLSSPERILSVASVGGSSINLTSSHSSTTNFQLVQLIDNAAGDLGVLYQTYPDIGANAPHEIYRVGLDGTGRKRLNMPLDPAGNVETGSFVQTPDGEFLVFGIVEKLRHSFNEAAYYMTPIEGGPIVRITPELPAMASIKQFKLSADGSRSYFTADSRTPGIDELFVSGLPMSRLTPGADVAVRVNGGLDLVGGVIASFEEVQTRGLLTATHTPGLIPLELGAATCVFHQWELDLTGQVAGSVALTFRYALTDLQAVGDEPAPTVYLKSPGGAWSPLEPALVAFQPGQFTVNLSNVDGVTIGLAAVPEPTSLLLAPFAALVAWVARQRAVASRTLSA